VLIESLTQALGLNTVVFAPGPAHRRHVAMLFAAQDSHAYCIITYRAKASWLPGEW
jgi:hypothetical protein